MDFFKDIYSDESYRLQKREGSGSRTEQLSVFAAVGQYAFLPNVCILKLLPHHKIVIHNLNLGIFEIFKNSLEFGIWYSNHQELTVVKSHVHAV